MPDLTLDDLDRLRCWGYASENEYGFDSDDWELLRRIEQAIVALDPEEEQDA